MNEGLETARLRILLVIQVDLFLHFLTLGGTITGIISSFTSGHPTYQSSPDHPPSISLEIFGGLLLLLLLSVYSICKLLKSIIQEEDVDTAWKSAHTWRVIQILVIVIVVSYFIVVQDVNTLIVFILVRITILLVGHCYIKALVAQMLQSAREREIDIEVPDVFRY